MPNTRSPWTITSSSAAGRFFADLKIICNGTTVVTRTVSGDSHEKLQAAVREFLKSEEANRLEAVYFSAQGHHI